MWYLLINTNQRQQHTSHTCTTGFWVYIRETCGHLSSIFKTVTDNETLTKVQINVVLWFNWEFYKLFINPYTVL